MIYIICRNNLNTTEVTWLYLSKHKNTSKHGLETLIKRLHLLKLTSAKHTLPYLHTLFCLFLQLNVVIVVQSLNHIWLFVAPWAAAHLTPCPSPSPRACSNPCPWSQWCHPTISSSVICFSSCLQFFLSSGSFLTSQLFSSGGQSTGASASASVLPMTIQDWFPLGLIGLISLKSKGLSRVNSFSNF